MTNKVNGFVYYFINHDGIGVEYYDMDLKKFQCPPSSSAMGGQKKGRR